jgi:hypothetical protein
MTTTTSGPAQRGILIALPLLALLLAGCTAPAVEPTPDETVACDVHVVVDFGVLGEDSIDSCAGAGSAQDVLADAGVATEGTVEYGDQIVCRVNDRPAAHETVTVEGEEPFTEPCTSMPVATAYWALWVKNTPDGEWEYAQEGVGTLELEAGQSVGLVYTAGLESVPPAG